LVKGHGPFVDTGPYDAEWDYLIVKWYMASGTIFFCTHVYQKGSECEVKHTQEILDNRSTSLAEARTKIPEIIVRKKTSMS
jgi:hypothetical protein